MLYWYLVLAIVCWGSAPVFDKIAVKNVDVYSGIFFRSLAITIVFGILHFLYRQTPLIYSYNIKGIIFFAISGILAGGMGAMFYYNALKLSDTSFVVPVVAVYPLVTAILSTIFLGEKITLSRIIGTIFIISGIWLIK